MIHKVAKSLYDLEITLDRFEEQIESLMDGVDATSTLVQQLNFDFKNVLKALRETTHSSDDYHIGESILDHMKDVLRNVNVLTTGWDEKRRNILRVVAFLHDISKPETFAVNKNKHTFYGHAQRGADVAKAVLEQFIDDSEEIKEYVEKLVKYHDTLFMLFDSKKRINDPNNVQYLKKFIQSGLALGEGFEDLKTFALADSITAHSAQSTLEAIEIISKDIDLYFKQQEEEQRQQALKAEKTKQALQQNRSTILSILSKYVDEADIPTFDAILRDGDMSSLNRELGMMKLYQAIKEIKKFLG